MKLEDLRPGTEVKGVLPSGVVSVIDVKWHGSDIVELTYKDATGRPDHELILRDREPTLEIVTEGRAWSFNADGEMLRLAEGKYHLLVY